MNITKEIQALVDAALAAARRYEDMACAAFVAKYDVCPTMKQDPATREFFYRSSFLRPREGEQKHDRAYVESRMGRTEFELLARRYADATDFDPAEVCVCIERSQSGEFVVCYRKLAL